ncbi:MAG: glycosyltransferase family 4 protein [Ardenticatenaceae bacterium]
MNSIRVVMVISSFAPVIGGAERQALQLAQRLLKRGLTVEVLTRRYPGLAATEEMKDVKVSRLPVAGSGRNPLSSVMFTAGVVLWLIRHAKEYDVAHVHASLSPAVSALLAKFATRKPVLVKVACSGPHGDVASMRRRPFLSLRRRLLRHTDRFLVLNSESIEELQELGLERSQMAPIVNGVDTTYFAPNEQKVQKKIWNRSNDFSRSGPGTTEVVTTVFVGRLTTQKGVDLLLEAWAQLAEPRELILVGDGAERPALEALASELKLDHVTFTGSTNDVRSYLQQADLFVLPSRAEGIPNAMLEAMACGLPVVASRVGGIPDVVEDGESGLLVPPDDVPALVGALDRLLADSDLRRQMGQKARERVVSDYSLKAATTRHLDLYREVIGLPERS